MKIELIIDKNCLSLDTFIEILNKLAGEFSEDEIKITSYKKDRQRLRDLGISLLPVWLVNDEVLRIKPDDYHSLREKIEERN